MRARQLWLGLALLLLVPGDAMAHRHTAFAYLLGSRLGGSSFDALSFTPGVPIFRKKEWSTLNLIGNFGRYSGTDQGPGPNDEKQLTLLSYAAGLHAGWKPKRLPEWQELFAQFWLGGVDEIEKIDIGNDGRIDTIEHHRDGIVAGSLGTDFSLGKAHHGLRFRAQVDLVHRFNRKTAWGISVGFGWRFPERDCCGDPCPASECAEPKKLKCKPPECRD